MVVYKCYTVRRRIGRKFLDDVKKKKRYCACIQSFNDWKAVANVLLSG